MVADSSGNAGTAVAAYAARAGIACEVYVPAATSAGKVAQLRAYGATVRQIPGSREDTADAAAERRRPAGHLLRQPRLPPVLPAGHEDLRLRAVGAARRAAARDPGAAGRQRHPGARRLPRLPRPSRPGPDRPHAADRRGAGGRLRTAGRGPSATARPPRRRSSASRRSPRASPSPARPAARRSWPPSATAAAPSSPSPTTRSTPPTAPSPGRACTSSRPRRRAGRRCERA